MKNLKLVLKILFIVFLAVSSYDNTEALWQKGALVVVATLLVLFIISDYIADQKKGQ